MTTSNSHNIDQSPKNSAAGTFGVRVSLPEGDPFARLVDADWSRVHWFSSRADRDAAITDMQRRHEYSRDTDKPALVFTAIERESDT